MVAANVLWRTIFARLLHHLFELQEAGGCTILMHTDTRSVKCTFVGAKEEVDVFCVCGSCGTKRGMRRWVSANLETIQGWPTLGLKSCAQFKSCAARRKSLVAAAALVVAAAVTVVVKAPLVWTQIMVGKTYPVALL